MPALIIDLEIGGIADKGDLVVASITVDNNAAEITEQETIVVDSGHATIEVTYTT